MWNTELQYGDSPLVPIQSQMNPIYYPPPPSNIHVNFIFPSRHTSFNISFWFSNRSFLCSCTFYSACKTSYPSVRSCFITLIMFAADCKLRRCSIFSYTPFTTLLKHLHFMLFFYTMFLARNKVYYWFSFMLISVFFRAVMSSLWFWNMGINKIWWSHFGSLWKENFESHFWIYKWQMRMENKIQQWVIYIIQGKWHNSIY